MASSQFETVSQLFLSDPHQMTLDPVVSAEMRHIAANRKYLDEIQNTWRGRPTQHRLNIHLGPVASGAVVLEDPKTVHLIKTQNRKNYWGGNGGVRCDGGCIIFKEESAKVYSD